MIKLTYSETVSYHRYNVLTVTRNLIGEKTVNNMGLSGSDIPQLKKRLGPAYKVFFDSRRLSADKENRMIYSNPVFNIIHRGGYVDVYPSGWLMVNDQWWLGQRDWNKLSEQLAKNEEFRRLPW